MANILDEYPWLKHSSLTATVRQMFFEKESDFIGLSRIFNRSPVGTSGSALDRKDLNSATILWDTIVGTREGTTLTVRGNPSVPLNYMTRERRSASMFQIFVKKTFNINAMLGLTTPGTYNEDYVQQLIREETEDMLQTAMITAESAIWTAFYSGDETSGVGQITGGSATDALLGPSFTYDMKLPVEVDAGSGIDWATAGDAILDDIQSNLKLKYYTATGMQPRVIYCSPKVLTNLLLSNDFKSAYTSNLPLAQILLGNWETITIAGLEFRNMEHRGTVARSTGTLTTFIPSAQTDQIIVLPDDATVRQHFKIYEAPIAVPTGNNGWEWSSPGITTYVRVKEDPTEATMYLHWTWLPVVKWPELFMRYDTSQE